VEKEMTADEYKKLVEDMNTITNLIKAGKPLQYRKIGGDWWMEYTGVLPFDFLTWEYREKPKEFHWSGFILYNNQGVTVMSGDGIVPNISIVFDSMGRPVRAQVL
jgi:hypothetical protein